MKYDKLPQKDIDIVRGLAAKLMEYEATPENIERRDAWYKLDSGAGDRTMVLAEAGGVQQEVFPEAHFKCESEQGRGLERGLYRQLFNFEQLKDDHVIEPFINIPWQVDQGNYGVEAVQHVPDTDGSLGARSWDAPLKNLDEDFNLLKPREFSVNRDKTYAQKEALEKVFEGITPVRIRGKFWWTLGMTINAIDLIGLENLMLYMFDNPEGLHRLMAFLCDDHIRFAKWLEGEGLLCLDNENDYIGSGSMGYTGKLPQKDWKPGDKVRTCDMWALLESQETVGVGPEQFEEFIFPYQAEIAEHFGQIYYGCCEPVHTRIHILKRLSNLARMSVSPWADEEKMAAELGRDIVYSRKPNPSLISTGNFDEAVIRRDLRKTLDTARGCRLEIVMKDVHTLNNEPERLSRWVQIAREEIG